MGAELERRTKRVLLWVLAAYAGNYIAAGISWGLGLIAAALATAGTGLDWPYTVPFFLGVFLVVSALLAAVARWLLPERWFESPETSTRPLSEDEVLARLDDVGIYIIRTQLQVESAARLDPNMVVGPFSPPPPSAHGTYGPFTNHDARAGYERLRDLGIIERESYDSQSATTRYRWTTLGRAVAERL